MCVTVTVLNSVHFLVKRQRVEQPASVLDVGVGILFAWVSVCICLQRNRIEIHPWLPSVSQSEKQE